MTLATTLVVVLAAGIGSQLLAARLRIPAIVVLIAVGLTLGPVAGLVTVPMDPEDLSEVIGLGVAVILFEGGMSLRVSELRRVGRGVGRLTILGPPVAMGLGAVAAHYIAGIDWPVALVLAAILVVTGPTVIGPLLRQANLNRDSSSLLRWEGIVNDPTGVLLAFLTFQVFALSEGGIGSILTGFALSLVVGGAMGALAGGLLGVAFHRGWVQSHLKAPLLLVAVLVIATVGNEIQDETGLIAVTAMGLVLGNIRIADRETLLHFKESLTVVLVSSLFIVIPATLTGEDLRALDWRIVLFVVALMVVVRPLTIALVSMRSTIGREDRILLGWIAPRGIVAAATAGVFGPAMVEAGYADGALLVPTVFLVIIVTVVAHGFTLAPLARRLGLVAGDRSGLLVVGASRFALALAEALGRLGVGVTVADGRYQALRPLRMAGVHTYFGEVLSERAEEDLDMSRHGVVLAATDADAYNALVARELGAELGHHRAFQLAPTGEAATARSRLAFERRAAYAFDGRSGLADLEASLTEGSRIRATHLTREFGWRELEPRLAGRGGDALIVGAVDPHGQFRLFSPAQAFLPLRGWTVLSLGPDDATAPDGVPAVGAEEDGAA